MENMETELLKYTQKIMKNSRTQNDEKTAHA